MKPSTSNKIEGAARQAAGKIKETTGRAINNPDMEAEGTAEKISGKVERKVGEVQKVLGH